MRPARIIAATTLTAAVIATGSYLALSTTSHRAAAPTAPVSAAYARAALPQSPM